MIQAQNRSKKFGAFKIIFSVFVLIFGLTSLTACSGTTHTRGNLPDPKLVAEIRKGIHRREDVQALIGVPSSLGTFSDKTWYYIGRKTEQLAFFEPDVIEQKVLVISFDDNGTVRQIQQLDKGHGRNVDFVSRETPTSGHSISFLQQLLGNMGNYNTGDSK